MEITSGLRQTITTEYNLKQIFIVTFFHYFNPYYCLSKMERESVKNQDRRCLSRQVSSYAKWKDGLGKE